MSSESQKSGTALQLVREEFERVFENREIDTIDELYARNCVVRTPDHELHGPEEYKAYVSAALDAFSDFDLELHDFIAGEDEVATRHSWRATHQGELRGIPPTGENVEVTGMLFARVENGQFTEVWQLDDMLGMLQQLGAIPDGTDD